MKLRSALIKLHSLLLGKCPLISDRFFAKTAYFLSFGRFPDLEAPKSFNEHICAIKCSEKALNYAPSADKYEARRFVEEKLGSDYLNPIYGIYEAPEEIPYESLPSRFVLKCTHASGFNVVVRDKASLDISKTNKTLRRWLKKNYYSVGREWNYKHIRPRILVDSYIDDVLQEYKIFCFHGVPKLIDVNLFHGKDRTTGLFTPQWERLPVTLGYAPCTAFAEAPQQLPQLLSAAATLSEGFDFVRVDLYLHGEKILFSELTFTSGGGLVHFDPKEYDRTLGDLFEEKP